MSTTVAWAVLCLVQPDMPFLWGRAAPSYSAEEQRNMRNAQEAEDVQARVGTLNLHTSVTLLCLQVKRPRF